MMMSTSDPYARPETGQPGPGLATGAEQYYSDGFRPGDFKQSYGVLAQLLQRNPGWYLADGTVVLEDGTTPPDMRGRFIIGAGGAFALGATGGSATHGHGFTHEEAHGITQPVIATHVLTQPVLFAHGDHGNLIHTGSHSRTAVEVTGLTFGASGSYLVVLAGGVGLGTINETISHASPAVADHTVPAHTLNHSFETQVGLTNLDHPLTTNVALSKNAPHEGGAVHNASGDTGYPPYAALYILIKKH